MDTIQQATEYLKNYDGRPVRIMEVCGTHTHEIFRSGVRQMLSPKITLISGPGCPVCVTPVGFIDEAVMLAEEKGAVVCTFGDLVRVPGTKSSLADARSRGAEIRVVYAPQDAVEYAKEHPDRQVVFLAVGFETTTPASCLAVKKAQEAGLENFSILTANKTMPGAYDAMKHSTDLFLYPGHVHAITGTGDCEKLEQEGISGVIAGFTPRELVTALAVAVSRFDRGETFFVNCYPRVVRREGSPAAQRLVEECMEPCDAVWRGIGMIPGSGMQLREAFAAYDSRKKFQLPKVEGRGNPACRCGDVLQGKCTPKDCKLFGKGCTPEHPIGACMVSDEGSCSAFYLYSDINP